MATPEYFGSGANRLLSIYWAIIDPSRHLCKPSIHHWGMVASEQGLALSWPVIAARHDCGAVLAYVYGGDMDLRLNGKPYPAYAGEHREQILECVSCSGCRVSHLQQRTGVKRGARTSDTSWLSMMNRTSVPLFLFDTQVPLPLLSAAHTASPKSQSSSAARSRSLDGNRTTPSCGATCRPLILSTARPGLRYQLHSTPHTSTARGFGARTAAAATDHREIFPFFHVCTSKHVCFSGRLFACYRWSSPCGSRSMTFVCKLRAC